MDIAKKYHSLNISGMTCANCAKGIEKHLTKKGIKEIKVDFANAEAHFLSNDIEIDDVIKEIESIGFQAKTEEIEEDNKVEKLFVFCLILTIPLFSHMFLNENHILHNPIIQGKPTQLVKEEQRIHYHCDTLEEDKHENHQH